MEATGCGIKNTADYFTDPEVRKREKSLAMGGMPMTYSAITSATTFGGTCGGWWARKGVKQAITVDAEKNPPAVAVEPKT